MTSEEEKAWCQAMLITIGIMISVCIAIFILIIAVYYIGHWIIFAGIGICLILLLKELG